MTENAEPEVIRRVYGLDAADGIETLAEATYLSDGTIRLDFIQLDAKGLNK